MKKITDERLILQNLQHIRVVYVVQTVGILAILGFELYQGGLEAMRANPVWLVFMVTTIVYAYLSMSTSVEHESTKNPKKGVVLGISVVAAIAIVAAVLTTLTPGYDLGTGLLVGGVLLICGVIPVTYVYKLRVKQWAEWEE